MRLGNDIVDLKIDADVHPRFLNRILHPNERSRYADQVGNNFIWKLWAAKEAAFKAHRQKPSPEGFFIPNRFNVDFERASVSFQDEVYILDILETEEFVLAIARSEDFTFSSGILTSDEELSPPEQRQQAALLRKNLGLSEAPPAKDEIGIPRCYENGEAIPYSLSQHGRHTSIVRGV